MITNLIFLGMTFSSAFNISNFLKEVSLQDLPFFQIQQASSQTHNVISKISVFLHVPAYVSYITYSRIWIIFHETFSLSFSSSETSAFICHLQDHVC